MKLKYLLCSIVISILSSMTAFAGEWVLDNVGYHWVRNDGTGLVNEWAWLDGNQDGIAECYYFDEKGYMVANTTLSDGSYVNDQGAWTVDGVVQIKEVVKPQINDYLGTYHKYKVAVDFFEDIVEDTNKKMVVTEQNGELYISGDFYGNYYYTTYINDMPKKIDKCEWMTETIDDGHEYFTMNLEYVDYEGNPGVIEEAFTIFFKDNYLVISHSGEDTYYVKE